MVREKNPGAGVQPQALPDTIAEQEAAVIDRHLGLTARHDLAIDVDQDIVIAPVRRGGVSRGGFFAGNSGWQ